MTLRVILFDLDGTLVDSRRDLANSVRRMQARYHAPLSSDEMVATFIGDGVNLLVTRALPGLAGEELARAVEHLKDYYREHCLEHTAMYPGVLDALQELKEFKMAIVTNKPERISCRILEGLGLLDYFPVVIGGDTLKEKKPHPAPLLKALEQLGDFSSSEAVMVGDSSVDVQAARAAKMKVVGVLSNIGDQSALRTSTPDFLLEDFSGLATLLLHKL
jgi:phosphoglycolate phosphatase